VNGLTPTIRESHVSLEQVCVDAGTLEDDMGFINTVNQEPVRLYVAFPPILKIANQNTIPIFPIKDFPFD